MPTSVLSHEAEIDIAGTSEYIAKHNVTAAIKMLDLIQEACQTLAENPGLGEVRKGYGEPELCDSVVACVPSDEFVAHVTCYCCVCSRAKSM
jgi:plasmid stabilization system protein ParE